MSRQPQIRNPRGGTFRRHYLKEWMEERDMSVTELLDLLNEAADMNQGVTDKTQVYRWLRGQLPHKSTQIRIAAALSLTDKDTGEPNPELLITPPTVAWIARKVSDMEPDDIERLKTIVETAFPDKTGTNG